MITLVLARAENGVIGRDGALPWHLPADLKRFKALTMGRPMIMGRKTFESFPSPLPGRRHIVLTRDHDWSASGAEVAQSVEEAIKLAGGDASIIGGAEVFELFRDIADHAELTVIWRGYDGDTVFDLDQGEDWVETARDYHAPEGDAPGYTFFSLRRPNREIMTDGRIGMRKWVLGVVGLLIAAAIAFFVLAPSIVERGMNKVVPVPLNISPRARALHATLQIADMHADTLLWQRSLLDRSTRGQIDLPRLQEGNYALQVFSSVTKTPKGQNYDANPSDTDNITALAIADLQPVRTWGSLLQRSLWHAEKLHRYAANSSGQLRVIETPADLDRLLADRAEGRKVVGGMLSVEGLQDIEGKLANLDRLHAAGFRMAGLAHFFDNEVAGSMHGEAKGGLTPFGRQVVRRMEAIGMIVDVAHSSHATVADVIAMARRPIVSSHGGVQATCRVNRNLTDDEIRGIARTGGVIGIGYWDAAVCSTRPEAAAAAIAHVRDVAGIDHVGLGSDFDGAVTTGFDASQLAAVTQALIDRGFSDADIAKVMGGNVLRVLRAGMAPGR